MTALEERMATVEARLGKIEFVLVDKGPDLSD
jgi:hypothetical protein